MLIIALLTLANKCQNIFNCILALVPFSTTFLFLAYIDNHINLAVFLVDGSYFGFCIIHYADTNLVKAILKDIQYHSNATSHSRVPNLRVELR